MSDIVFPTQNKEKVKHFTAQGFYRGETLSAWLHRTAGTSATDSAIVSAETTFTYAELMSETSKLAAGLQSLGLGKNDIVAVQLPNIPEFIISYLAIASIGGIMQTLHMPYRQSELEYLLGDSGATTVICLSEFKDVSPADTMLEVARSNETLVNIISLGEISTDTIDFKRLMIDTNDLSDTTITANDLFVLLYTSGTTSSPKGVPHRYNNFLTNARLCCEEYGFTQKDKLLSVAPMTHLYGLFTYNMTLAAGATSVLLPGFSPEAFVNVVKTQRPTAIFAAPAHFASCFQQKLLKQADFENVKFICLSGSTVMPDLAKDVDRLLTNGVAGQLWGMSELQAGTITRLHESEHIRCHYSGQATAGTELQIIDTNDNVMPVNVEGELRVRGLSVFDGYLNKDDETRQAFSQDGWFRTGDMALLNEQGHLKITGRTKNLINRGGVKYNPVEIEAMVNGLPQVHQCAIIPKADAVYGEIACLFIVANINTSISLTEVCAMLDNEGVAKYKWPEQMFIIDKMPLTPTNKIKLEELEKHLQ